LAIFGCKDSWLSFSIEKRFKLCNDRTWITANPMNKGFLICLYFNTSLKEYSKHTILKLLLFPCRFHTRLLSFSQNRHNIRSDENRKDKCSLEFSCLAVSEVLFAVSYWLNTCLRLYIVQCNLFNKFMFESSSSLTVSMKYWWDLYIGFEVEPFM
jgi:hypothetical protein